MEAIRQQRIENRRIARPRLEVLVKRANAVPFEEGLARANRENKVIASSKKLDKALNETGEWISILDAFPCWSGTMTGYKEPGEKLGKSVVYTDPETKQRYVFPVPEDYKGAKNAILVVEHPDYTLEKDGKDRIVAVKNIENISLIENFPSEYDGWYQMDEKHGIPTGNEVDSSNPDVRYLFFWRSDSRVGPVHHSGGFYNGGSGVILNGRPSSWFGMAVEVPENNAKNEGDEK